MRPYATCWFGTNHLPHTRDFSEAFFRRAIVLDFNRVFGEREKDPHLLDKLTTELSGILNLCLDAYASALVSGFTDPPSSKLTKQKWRLETDQVQQFVSESCLVDPSYTTKSSSLYSTYKCWALDNGIKKTLGSRTFAERLDIIGYGRVRRNDGVYVSGLKSN
jgi:putative DNA primase/helicase